MPKPRSRKSTNATVKRTAAQPTRARSLAKRAPVDPCSSEERWVYADAPDRPDVDSHYVGKWLIWARCRQVRPSWGAVRAGTEDGVLGISAKIAGHRPLPPYVRPKDLPDDTIEWAELSPPQELHVICVYTYDWRDLSDLERVGRTLAELKAVTDQPLRYKSDDQTRLGVYAPGGPVSLFKMAPPYDRLEAGDGLARWASVEPELAPLLERLR